MKRYFTLAKNQKIGVVAVAIIVLIQILIFSRQNNFVLPDPTDVDTSLYAIHFIDSVKTYKKKNKFDYKKINYHNFNPNTFTAQNWIEFGFSKKQSVIIVNYKNKIDGFKCKEDVKKVFVINNEKYSELEPYIELPNKITTSKSFSKNKTSHQPPIDPVEVNIANAQQLTSISGIGEFTANGIIKYRKLLGGFHASTQLKEVYGISDENYLKIIPQITIDQTQITKLNVNELSIPSLKNHPYINWKTANAIIDERLKNKLDNIQFLTDKKLLTEAELKNLLPYIEY